MRSCQIKNCNGKHFGRGFCVKHYHKARVNGEITGRSKFDPNNFITEGDLTKIECFNRDCASVGYTIVDTKEVDKLKGYKWYIDNKGYVRSNNLGFMHNIILGITPTMQLVVDHIDRNPLNNTKKNLRTGTYGENNCNRDIVKRNTSGCVGICWNEKRNKWFAQITFKGKHNWLGYFVNKIDAIVAYNKAAKELHGEFAVLNKIPLLRRVQSDNTY